MAPRRVAVTGLGVICALGHDVPAFWNALCAGRPGIARIESVDMSTLRFQNGAEVRDYSHPAQHFDDGRRPTCIDRFAQFARDRRARGRSPMPASTSTPAAARDGRRSSPDRRVGGQCTRGYAVLRDVLQAGLYRVSTR